MRNWMVRGLVFAGVMVVIRLIQGAMINAWPTMSGLISLTLLVLFVIGVIMWGLADGRADARAQPDPDRREDLAMTWLLAGILAGILSGLVSSIIAMFYTKLYTGGLISEVTTFAAFTALAVFVPAIIGVSTGRWLIDRNAPPVPKHEHSRERSSDTDVFSAVRADDSPTGEIPVGQESAQTEQRTAVATAEREGRTEAIPTQEGRTEAIPTGRSESPTEEIRFDDDATRRGDKPGRG